MDQLLFGTWRIKAAANAAAEVFDIGVTEVEIQPGLDNSYMIDSRHNAENATQIWTVDKTTTDGSVVAGTIDVVNGPTYHVLFTVQVEPDRNRFRKKLVGVVYGTDIGGGSDPGAWESDDDGSGTEGG